MRSIIIGVLTLGISLYVPPPVWADGDFRVTNQAHGPLKVNCSTQNITDTVSHGTSADFSCTGTFFVQRVGGHPEHTISFSCPTGQVAHATATAADSGEEISVDTVCEDTASEGEPT